MVPDIEPRCGPRNDRYSKSANQKGIDKLYHTTRETETNRMGFEGMDSVEAQERVTHSALSSAIVFS